LAQKGLEDSKTVTRALKDKNISRIYASPYRRTADTVMDISRYLDQEIALVDDLRERKVGEWVEDFRSYARKQWDDFDYKLSEGESLREVQARNIAALFEIIARDRGERVIVATHGTALSTIINYFRPEYGFDDFWKIIDKMPYIICMEFEGRNLRRMTEVF
jgi:2,3-bisphosphoglycerate-dependent phosphoglycerate mutase